MAFWLYKSEPFKWSWEMQKAKGEVGEEWTGVRNYLARNNMRGMKPIDAPVNVIITHVKPRPKSHTIAQKAVPWATTKPDLDNIAKVVLDAMNGIVYSDDSRVALLSIQKVYRHSQEEYIEVSVHDLSDIDLEISGGRR